MDAIHLATALNRSATEFHTTDERLQKNWQDIGFAVRDPVTEKPKLFST